MRLGLFELGPLPLTSRCLCISLLRPLNADEVLWALWSAEQAVAAEVSLPKPRDLLQCMHETELRRLLVLDGLQDPGNLVCMIDMHHREHYAYPCCAPAYARLLIASS